MNNPDEARADALAARNGVGGDVSIPDNLNVSHSDDGQYLLIRLGRELLAIYGGMGADPEVVEFADGGRIAVEELLDRLQAS